MADADARPVAAPRAPVIFLGPAGAGKGTQAERLAAWLNVPRISTGDMLREALARGSALGRAAAPYLERGELVPDQLLIDMIHERVKDQDCARGYILDGFPRTLPQAQALDAMLGSAARSYLVLNLEVPREELLRRLSGRGREDDKDDAVERRLYEYEERTKPLVEFYTRRGNLHRVDGFRSMDAVTRDLQRIVGGLA